MPKKSDGPGVNPMASEVERLLRELAPRAAPRRRSPPRAHPTASRPPGRPPPPPLTVTLPSPLGVWLRATLGVVLAGAMTQWPYALCGRSLAAYFAALAVVAVAGGWAGHASWRRRMGRAHVLSIAVVFFALGLAGLRLLPLLGYGPVATSWACP